MTKTLSITLLAILALGGIVWLGKLRVDRPAINNAPGAFTLERSLHDFGRISMAGGDVSTTFSVMNETSTDILVKNIFTSCMCTVAYISGGESEKGPFGMPGHGGPSGASDELVKAGESRKIEVIFDPAAHGPAGIGKVERIISLEDSLGRVTELKFSAFVTP